MAHDSTLITKEAILKDEATTLAFGGRFAQNLLPGLVIYLHGNLGAGKTTFVRGVLKGLGHIGKVKSPTYTLVETYELEPYIIKFNVKSRLYLYHLDLYRFMSEEEWEAAGFREYFNPQSICMIEWPEKAAQVLPQPDIDVHFSLYNSGRIIQFSARSVLGKQCLENCKF